MTSCIGGLTSQCSNDQLDLSKTYSECTGAVKVIACIEDPKVIRQILDHLKHKGEYQDAIQLPDSRTPPQVDRLH